MAEMLQGKSHMLFMRAYKDRETEDGAKLRFQTEHSVSEDKETETIGTKDGNQITINDGESTIDITSYAYNEDDGTEAFWKQVHRWFKDNEKVEIWDVDVSNPTEEGSVTATYYRGYFTSFEQSKPYDGNIELSLSYSIEGTGVEGTDVLTPEQLAVAEGAQYEYLSLNSANVTE